MIRTHTVSVTTALTRLGPRTTVASVSRPVTLVIYNTSGAALLLSGSAAADPGMSIAASEYFTITLNAPDDVLYGKLGAGSGNVVVLETAQ